MKKYLVFLLLTVAFQGFAQTNLITGINISLPANPDANTANWGSGISLFTITANSKAANGRVDGHVTESKILVTIKKGGAKVCGSFTANSAPASNFNTLTKVWSGSNAVSLLGQGCVLPAGEYELTVQFFGNGAAGIAPLSEEKIKPFSIRAKEQLSYQPPQAISPANGAVLSEIDIKKPLTLRWTPVVPRPQEPVTYQLKVWQLMQGQTSAQAMRVNQPIITKDVDNMTQAVVNNIIDGPCKPPYLCDFIWNVQALNREGKPIGGNDGNSSPNTFSVNNNKLKTTPATDPGDSSVTGTGNPPPAVVDSGTAVIGDSIRAGLNGEFIVIITDVAIETDGSLTGKGKVRIPWLKTYVAVEFKKIRIDTTRRLTLGGIVTTESGSAASSYIDYPKAWALSLLSGPGVANAVDYSMNVTNNIVDNLVGWVNNVAPGSQPLINYDDTIPTPAIPNNSLKMPFGLVFKNANDLLVITEMIFKPNESKINFLAQKLFTKGVTDYKLGFAGKYFKIHPHRIEFANGRVELVEDIDVPNLVSDPKMKFTFKKGAPAAGCYIEWDSTGVKDIGLGLDVKFTRDWLLPVPTASDSVKATISGNGTSLQNILLTGSLSNCEIVGTNGIKILADSIALDLSDTRNPASMYFPANYTSDTTAQGKLLWQGLYIKTLGLTLPDTWKTGANPTQITAANTIIDDYGVTMKVKAINIITFPMGRVSDMSASLDTLNLSILKGSLTDGNAKGKLVLPISRDTITNTLKYTATFAQVGGANNFQIAIVPTGPIDADILKGKMTLSPTSNITASLSDSLKSMSINLNGKFNWGDKDLAVTDTATATGAAPIRKKGIKGIKMEMDFENMKLDYTNNSAANTNTLSFNPGSWSFASPQKRLANFPVTIKKVYYKSLTTVAAGNNVKELVRGALMIDIVANLTDDIGGSTTVGAAFAIQINTSAKKFLPKFKGVFIEDISVYADMPAVKIDGKLKMYDNDSTYGDGFMANLGVKFTAVSLQANALVQFGNTVYNNNNQYYRYWRAEADAKFKPGIPFLTGIGFYGFGGGAFYNMEGTPVQKAAPEVGFRYSFKPQKSSLGFVAMAIIGTMPKVETFNSDVKLIAQFNANTGGLTQIGFTGDFWMAAKLEERNTAKLLGGVAIDYTFPTKIFSLSGLLQIKAAPAIETLPNTPLAINLRIDGYNNKWYFKCGVPNNPNTVKVLNVFNLYSYFMFGNDLGNDVPNGFTPGFVSEYNSTFPGNPIINSSVGGTNLTTTGAGIALGVGIKIEKPLSTSLPSGLIRNWDFNFLLKAGAELNAALLEYNGACGGFNPVGIRGYRASGSVGFYAHMTGALKGTVKDGLSFYGANKDKSYSIIDIKGGGWLIGAFPNPEYFQGAIDGEVGLFDDLVDINFHKDFTYGTTDCGAMTPTAGVAIVEKDTTQSFKNNLIKYVTPATHYNFPKTETINVKYTLVPNQVFDVAEYQSDGSIKTRTFKLVVTRTLEVKNTNGAWVIQNTNVKANNIGEYQYYIKPPITSVPANQPMMQSGAIAAAAVSGATPMTGVGGVTPMTVANRLPAFHTNSGNSMMAANGIFHVNNIISPVPPPPAPNYPNPALSPVNGLVADKDYRFKVTATLQELTGNNWTTAITKVGSIPVIQTITKLFRTGGLTQLVQDNNL